MRALDNIVLARNSDSLVQNIVFSISFESSIQETRITLVVCFQLTKNIILAQRSDFVPKQPRKRH